LYIIIKQFLSSSCCSKWSDQLLRCSRLPYSLSYPGTEDHSRTCSVEADPAIAKGHRTRQRQRPYLPASKPATECATSPSRFFSQRRCRQRVQRHWRRRRRPSPSRCSDKGGVDRECSGTGGAGGALCPSKERSKFGGDGSVDTANLAFSAPSRRPALRHFQRPNSPAARQDSFIQQSAVRSQTDGQRDRRRRPAEEKEEELGIPFRERIKSNQSKAKQSKSNQIKANQINQSK
jgi:hypothetical protein